MFLAWWLGCIVEVGKIGGGGATTPTDPTTSTTSTTGSTSTTDPWTETTETTTTTTTATTTTTTTTTPTTTTTTTTEPVEVSVFDLQDGSVTPGAEVVVRDVIVTATAMYGFYVQDPAGGPRSGLWVYPDLGWELAWPVEAGDEVRVTGTYEEYFGLTELNLTTAANPDVVVTGTGEIAPELVGAGDLGEDWEGVLVEVDDLWIDAPDVGNGEFTAVDALGAVVLVDDQVHAWSLYGTLPAGATVHAVVGVVYENAGEYKLEPRSDEDLDVAATTPYALQDGTVIAGTEVELYGVVVTGVDEDGLFVQAEDGGARSGVWVYLGLGWEYTWGLVLPGDRVDVGGLVGEYYDLTEVDLTVSSAPFVAWVGSGALPSPEVIAVADVGEDWESVLVEVQNVEVVAPDLGYGEFSVDPFGVGSGAVVVDDQLHQYSGFGLLAAGDRFDAIRGPLNYSFGAFKIEPRAEGDFDRH